MLLVCCCPGAKTATGHGHDITENRSAPGEDAASPSPSPPPPPFSLRVIVLTMNRPQALARLLTSLSNTFFQHHADSLHVEIHVDKAHG